MLCVGFGVGQLLGTSSSLWRLGAGGRELFGIPAHAQLQRKAQASSEQQVQGHSATETRAGGP